MLKKLCFLTFFVLFVFLASAGFGIADPCVIGSWEIAGDPEGWIDWKTGEAIVGPKYEWTATGATLGSGSIKITAPGDADGWEQNLSIKLQGRGLVPDFFANTVFAIDVSVPGDADANGSCEIFTVSLNGDGYGWHDLDEEKPHYQWGFPDDGSSDLRTTTVWWNYAASFETMSENPGYVEFILATTSDTNGHDTYYFDNARLIDSSYAFLPNPADNQTDVSIETDLSWNPGNYAQYHDIYFGTSYAEVNDANNNDTMGETEVYRAHQSATSNTYTIPETLDMGKTYYWRIDVDTGSEVLKGAVWSFESRCRAKALHPFDYATEVERILELSWRPGFTGASHDVYFGTSFADVSAADDEDPMGPGEIYRAQQNPDANTYTVPETLKAGQTYFWRIDEFNDPCGFFFQGDVWRFTTLNPNARDPYPTDGSNTIYINMLKLMWAAGPFAASHDVYFGTNYNEVLNADDDDTTGIFRGNQTGIANEYALADLDAPLELETTYYWRIDEVNLAHPDVNWTGSVWSFTIPDYVTIDDFEDYLFSVPEGSSTCPYYTSGDLRWVWLDGHVQKNPQGDCGGDLLDYNPLAIQCTVGRLPGSRIIRTETGKTGYGLSYYYNNNNVDNTQYPPEQAATEDRYSEVLRFYPGGIDLTANGKVSAGALPVIEVSYMGNPANAADTVYDRMYMVIEDMDVTTSGTHKYRGDDAQIDNPDSSATRAIVWTQWAVKLSDFTDKNSALDLTRVRSVRIGIGKRLNPYSATAGGEGTVIFDNLRLYGEHCVLSERSSGFADADYGPVGNPPGDCVIDYEEIGIMGDDWLATDAVTETNDPGTDNLVAYYPMSEGEGDTIADDTGDPCHVGTFSAEGVSWVSPGVAGGSCVHMDGDGSSPGARITIGDWNPAEGTGQLTLSMWVRWTGPRYPTAGQPQGLISKRGGWNEETVMFIFEMDTPDAENLRGSFGFRQYTGDYAVWSEGGIMDAFIGQWAHLAATFDGTTSETAARIYLNGREVASGQYTFGGGSGEGIYMAIGNNNDTSWGDCPGVFNGDIDEVRMYNRALSASEVAYLADYATNPGDGVLHVPVPSNAELYDNEPEGERMVNFRDYAMLAERWLDVEIWP